MCTAASLSTTTWWRPVGVELTQFKWSTKTQTRWIFHQSLSCVNCDDFEALLSLLAAYWGGEDGEGKALRDTRHRHEWSEDRVRRVCRHSANSQADVGTTQEGFTLSHSTVIDCTWHFERFYLKSARLLWTVYVDVLILNGFANLMTACKTPALSTFCSNQPSHRITFLFDIKSSISSRKHLPQQTTDYLVSCWNVS